MNVLEDARDTRGWITAIIESRWCQAKVYDEPSTYGINNGRVSKLAVAKEGVAALGMHTGLNFFENVDFNYDRGLDFDNLKEGLLNKIVAQLEALPKIESNYPPPEADMKDAEREKIAASAAAYRRASRDESMPKDEADRMADMDVQEAMKLLDDPVETLRWAVEKLYAHVPVGDTDNHVLFAVRRAVAGHRRSASNSESN